MTDPEIASASSVAEIAVSSFAETAPPTSVLLWVEKNPSPFRLRDSRCGAGLPERTDPLGCDRYLHPGTADAHRGRGRTRPAARTVEDLRTCSTLHGDRRRGGHPVPPHRTSPSVPAPRHRATHWRIDPAATRRTGRLRSHRARLARRHHRTEHPRQEHDHAHHRHSTTTPHSVGPTGHTPASISVTASSRNSLRWFLHDCVSPTIHWEAARSGGRFAQHAVRPVCIRPGKLRPCAGSRSWSSGWPPSPQR